MFKKLGMSMVAVGISVLMSGCLVEKKDTTSAETISRTSDFLRVYQPGDFIEYNLSELDLGTFISTQGVIRIQWEQHADLDDPITSGTTYPVLKETTTITYDGNTSPDAVVIRYISQVDTVPASADQGSIILHAIGDGTDLYWPYDPSNTATPSSPVLAPVIFDSPMAVGVQPANSPLEYSVMEGCGTGSCGTEIYKYNDGYTIEGDTSTITNNVATFSDPFEISFSGRNASRGVLALSVLGDIRHACGTSTAEDIEHSGNMFVMPHIGIIQMTNYCRVIGGTGNEVNQTITLRNTNIPLS